MSGLAGRVVWVTGASSGIGEAVARELVARGCRVGLSARNVEALERLAGEGGDTVVAPADISDPGAVRAALAAITERFGGIDVAFLNAGAYAPLMLADFGAEAFRPHVEVNLMGTVHCIEALLPDMLRRDRGRIAVVASVAGLTGMPLASAYGASKAFQVVMCQSLQADLAAEGSGVEVTIVMPGFVRSGLTDKNDFAMPFLMEAPEAARIIADGLEAGDAEIAFPKRTYLYMKGQQVLPGALRRFLAARTAQRVYRQQRESLDEP